MKTQKKEDIIMKKIFICLLAALLLTSCGKSSTQETTAPDTAPVDTTAVETESSVDDLFQIEKEDNAGKTFSILSTESFAYEFDAQETTGEPVNDAVYERNMMVENLLGIDFNFVFKPGHWADKDSYCQLITNSVMAADGAFDVVSGIISCVQPIATPKTFMNVYDLPDINLDNPWWVSELQNGLTINGKLISFMGDMSLSLYTGLSVIFANLDMMENKGLENPYDLVYNNQWTIDKMTEICTDAGQDLNGDGTYVIGEDVFAMGIDGVILRSMQSSLGLQAISLGEDGYPVVNTLSEKMSYAVDTLHAFLNQNKAVSYDDLFCNNPEKAGAYFAADQILFFMTRMDSVSYMRDMESDFAILPFPKLDTNQENYLTQIATATHMSYIPTTTNDAALTGKVCEAMSYYSYKNIVPAYYEVSLKNKYSRDENTQKMLDIIRSGAVMPFEYAFSTVIAGNPWPNELLVTAIVEDGQIASLIASGQKAWETAIDKLMASFQE